LLTRQLLFKFSCNKINIYNLFKRDNKDKEKNNSIKEKRICNKKVAKIIEINNILLTNILIVCNKSNKNKSIKLLFFERFENIKS